MNEKITTLKIAKDLSNKFDKIDYPLMLQKSVD